MSCDVAFCEYSNDNYSAELLSKLNSLRPLFHDVTLIVEDSSFVAHRVVLSAASPYFEAMFTSSLAESKLSQVPLVGLDADAVGLLLDFVYTNRLRITPRNVHDIIRTADFFQMHRVKIAASHFLTTLLSAANCLKFYSFAKMYTCEDLLTGAKKFIQGHFADIAQFDEFLSLAPDELIELISDDDLEEDNEEVIFEAVLRWYNEMPEQRKPVLHEVLEHVRLSLLSTDFLTNRVRSLDVIETNEDCRLLVIASIYYQSLPVVRQNRKEEVTRPRSGSLCEVMVALGWTENCSNIGVLDLSTKQWIHLARLPHLFINYGICVVEKERTYLAGGCPDKNDCDEVIDCAWLYDSFSDRWQQLASMRVGRSGLGLAMLDGYLYAVGGRDEDLYSSNVVERYDPKLDTWTNVEAMETPVDKPAVIGHNGMLYVAGGSVYNRSFSNLFQRYDPVTNSWAELAPLRIDRSDAFLCAVGNSHLYLFGGWGHDGPEITVECYNIEKDCWESKASMLWNFMCHGIAVIGDKICAKKCYFLETYDPANDRWTWSNVGNSYRDYRVCGAMKVRKSIFREENL